MRGAQHFRGSLGGCAMSRGEGAADIGMVAELNRQCSHGLASLIAALGGCSDCAPCEWDSAVIPVILTPGHRGVWNVCSTGAAPPPPRGGALPKSPPHSPQEATPAINRGAGGSQYQTSTHTRRLTSTHTLPLHPAQHLLSPPNCQSHKYSSALCESNGWIRIGA